MRHLCIGLVAILGLALLGNLAMAQDEMPRPVLPDAFQGFAGELRGEVVAKWESAFTLRVQEIVRVWEHNEARRTESAVGRVLLINLRWEQVARSERWQVVPRQVQWLRHCVEVGQSVRVDVRNDEGEQLHLMELSREQRAAVERAVAQQEREGDRPREEPREEPRDAEQPRERAMPEPELPQALRGFSGELLGEVVAKWDAGFTLRVQDVTNIWRNNEAREPQAAVGRVLLINLRWERVEGTERHQVAQRQAIWLHHCVEIGHTVRADVRNDEGQRLHLMELNQEQRNAVERAQARLEREGEREQPRETERPREGDQPAERPRDGEGERDRPRVEAEGLPEARLPEGMHGFRGTVTGIVVQVGDVGFVLFVTAIEATEGNAARNLRSGLQQTLSVNAQWQRVEGQDRHRPIPAQVEWISQLRLGQSVTIAVQHLEGQRLHITSLPRASRR